MLSMYPWMQKEITAIDFCPDFDPSDCHFDPARCDLKSKHPAPARVLGGPGDDCQVPPMNLGQPGFTRKRTKK